jgi:DNA polymerase I
MARAHPIIAPLRELRVSLSQMRLAELAVGRDGRNRCLLSALRAKTGRNQPSNTAFIFGPAVWLRGLIRPAPGVGLAHIDWSQQEFGIAAALSGDAKMRDAYLSGDPYLAFAKQAGAVPTDGTKATHGPIREQFKACVLAVQYGMGEVSLAQRIGRPVVHARDLLRLHHETYRKFWRWSDAAVDHAMLTGTLHTVFGWTVHVGRTPNARSLRNFPMQANGAEMLRLACCYATERGIHVCAPVHDAILIEAPTNELDAAVEAAQRAMADASEAVLGGFRLRSDVKLIRFPDRYADERGTAMWRTVWKLIGLQPGDLCTGAPGTGASAQQYPCTSAHPSSLFSLSSLGL